MLVAAVVGSTMSVFSGGINAGRSAALQLHGSAFACECADVCECAMYAHIQVYLRGYQLSNRCGRWWLRVCASEATVRLPATWAFHPVALSSVRMLIATSHSPLCAAATCVFVDIITNAMDKKVAPRCLPLPSPTCLPNVHPRQFDQEHFACATPYCSVPSMSDATSDDARNAHPLQSCRANNAAGQFGPCHCRHWYGIRSLRHPGFGEDGRYSYQPVQVRPTCSNALPLCFNFCFPEDTGSPIPPLTRTQTPILLSPSRNAILTHETHILRYGGITVLCWVYFYLGCSRGA